MKIAFVLHERSLRPVGGYKIVQASRSEGWGLPATEAMACGCALVTWPRAVAKLEQVLETGGGECAIAPR